MTPSDNSSNSINITVNERPRAFDGGSAPTLFGVWREMKPEADIVILNGFPLKEDRPLANGDEVILIKRGEIPPHEELEALMVSRHGPGVHAAIRNASVGIAGCGGLGSALAVALARCGIGRMLLVDFDIVEPSNLNRQQFFVDQLGQLKTEALAANLARINPYLHVEIRTMRLTRDNIPEVYSGCDVVAECFDDPAMKRDMAVAVRQKLPNTPLVTVSGIAGFGPSNDLRTRKIFHNVYLVGDTTSAAQPGRGLIAPRVAIAAGHQANAILRILLGLDPVEPSHQEKA